MHLPHFPLVFFYKELNANRRDIYVTMGRAGLTTVTLTVVIYSQWEVVSTLHALRQAKGFPSIESITRVQGLIYSFGNV